jgi:hypothetical protein
MSPDRIAAVSADQRPEPKYRRRNRYRAREHVCAGHSCTWKLAGHRGRSIAALSMSYAPIA